LRHKKRDKKGLFSKKLGYPGTATGIFGIDYLPGCTVEKPSSYHSPFLHGEEVQTATFIKFVPELHWQHDEAAWLVT
jgi:hypothetical protein